MKSSVLLSELSIGYRHRGETKVVARQSFHRLPLCRRVTCLIGPNGVGKSYPVAHSLGFLPPPAGRGAAWYWQPSRTPFQPHPWRAFAPDEHRTHRQPETSGLTVSDLVGMGRSPYTGFWGRLSQADRALVAEAMRQVGISHLSDRRISTLSDGERQKTMIAKALAQSTPILFLDEPTAFLDVSQQGRDAAAAAQPGSRSGRPSSSPPDDRNGASAFRPPLAHAVRPFRTTPAHRTSWLPRLALAVHRA